MKNICFIGVGGVGGYFGGIIAAKASHTSLFPGLKVVFIARGDHLKAIKKNELFLYLDAEDTPLICRPAMATDNVSDVNNIDVFFIASKSYDLNNILVMIKKKVKNNTIIIPLMNGIDIYNRIRSIIPGGIVLPACVYVSSYISRPGEIRQIGLPGRIVLGEDPHHPGFTPDWLLSLLDEMNVLYSWEQDPYPKIWEKYVLICSFALISSYYDKPLGALLENSSLLAEFIQHMEELCSIAQGLQIRIPEDLPVKIIELLKKYPYETESSYQRDLRKGKKRDEGDLFSYTIIRLGDELGIPTPLTKKFTLGRNYYGR